MNAGRLVRAGGFGLAAALVVGLAVSASAQPAGKVDPSKLIAGNLQMHVDAATKNVQVIDQRLKDAQKELDQLKEKAKAVPAPKDQPPAQADAKEFGSPAGGGGFGPPREDKKGAKELEFRLPLGRTADKNLQVNLAVVCQNQKVYLLDIKATDAAIDKAIQKVKDDQAKSAELGRKGTLALGPQPVNGGAFTIKELTLFTIPLPNGKVGIDADAELALRPDAIGETPEEARRPTSVFQKRLGELNPAVNVLQFRVYPDSFETFRAVRPLVWDRKFRDVNWMPLRVGTPIVLGGGGPIVVQ